MGSDKTRFGLDETRIPEAWYNVIPDLKNPPAPPRAFAPDGSELGPDQIGERLASRLAEMCWIVRMDGEDFRKTHKAARHLL